MRFCTMKAVPPLALSQSWWSYRYGVKPRMLNVCAGRICVSWKQSVAGLRCFIRACTSLSLLRNLFRFHCSRSMVNGQRKEYGKIKWNYGAFIGDRFNLPLFLTLRSAWAVRLWIGRVRRGLTAVGYDYGFGLLFPWIWTRPGTGHLFSLRGLAAGIVGCEWVWSVFFHSLATSVWVEVEWR
jgi:hypothetical protein